MSERTKELGKLYVHSLSIESMYEYKVHGPHGSNFSWGMASPNHMAHRPCIYEYFQ